MQILPTSENGACSPMCGSAEGSHPNSEHAESLAVLTHPATLRLIHCKTPLACHAMCVCVCVKESTRVSVPFYFHLRVSEQFLVGCTWLPRPGQRADQTMCWHFNALGIKLTSVAPWLMKVIGSHSTDQQRYSLNREASCPWLLTFHLQLEVRKKQFPGVDQYNHIIKKL